MNFPSVLGYSIRDQSITDRFWTEKRSSYFLVGGLCRSPRSADTNVWQVPREVELLRRSDSLWSSLREMRSDIEPLRIENSFGVEEAAFSICHSPSPPFWMEMAVDECEPKLLDNDFVSMGFDVVDSGLISGLMNCAFDSEIMQSLRRELMIGINDHGLYNEVERAVHCADRISGISKDHGQFHVIGVYARRSNV